MHSESELQLAGHVSPVPEQAKGLHEGLPLLPAAESTQMPLEHSPQDPHADEQQ